MDIEKLIADLYPFPQVLLAGVFGGLCMAGGILLSKLDNMMRLRKEKKKED